MHGTKVKSECGNQPVKDALSIVKRLLVQCTQLIFNYCCVINSHTDDILK